ncbi:hypothetical protein BO70DRAFT_400691 [Aspergillus heteromorphus CBS 117.55]|uniref:Uncharacterized protein n=1 Tax=Aspergillus heteromorphus CBS 117.55 TaxID=1448321 RepID=A0A317V0W0_9EURO|nr:uncharacterized protein BO70DRAFT_400691 [Aspergillus heteromorphus CBS 117.55]PWY66708.1 hypothetical protein BO70DRAFT_400691 [Aspergillus heteromorphus CBS 117.55]
MRAFWWSAVFAIGCMAAPIRPTHPLTIRQEVTQKKKRASPLTSDGDVDPTNDGTVNNDVSLIRLC